MHVLLDLCPVKDHPSVKLMYSWCTALSSAGKGLSAVSCHTSKLVNNNSCLRPFSGTTRVSRYQKKHSPTHHPDHHPTFISFFHLPRSIASSLFKLSALQSFLHNLSPCPLWSTSWSGALYIIFHTFLHPISVFFSQHVNGLRVKMTGVVNDEHMSGLRVKKFCNI